MSIKLHVLGCHSATPRVNAHPTAQVLEIKNHHFLIDCGEGTQVEMRKNKISFAKINHIFISHLHGDHFFGLIGLISTFGLLNRDKSLHIYGPVGLKEIIEVQLRLTHTKGLFPLVFHELSNLASELIFEDKKVEIYTIPLKHRVYCNGYIFKEKEGLRKLNIKAVKQFPEIQTCDYHNIKKGKDFVQKNGISIQNALLTLPPQKSLSYAFCSDTAYHPSIVSIIYKTDLLYHESTFLSDKEELAKKTMHSTALQAGKIAAKAKVGQLLLGHFSNRYKDLSAFKSEAQQIFEKVEITQEGIVYKVENTI